MDQDLYVGIYPDASTARWLKNLVVDAPFTITDQKFHVTLMFCRKLHAGITFDTMAEMSEPDKEYIAFADSVKIWKDHKKRDIVVLTIRSTSLLLRAKFWSKQGATHNFSTWTPHITLSNVLSPDEVSSLDTQKWLDNMNRLFNHKHFSMLFTAEHVNRIKPSSLESSLEEALAEMKNPLRKKNKKRKHFAPPMKRAHLAPLKRVGPVPKEMKEMKMPRLTIKRPYMKKQRKIDKERHEQAQERDEALMDI